MKIDLHIHTSERSHCAVVHAEDQIRAAIAAGLDAIAITDHDRLVPAALRRQWAAKYPDLRILPGIEISLTEDILVVGLDDLRLEQEPWTWPQLHGYVRGREGVLIVAHPFRYNDRVHLDCVNHPPDALEAYSTNLSPRLAPRIRSEAAKLGVPVVSNSDAHDTAPLGRYFNRLDGPAGGDAEILEAIRTGRFRLYTP